VSFTLRTAPNGRSLRDRIAAALTRAGDTIDATDGVTAEVTDWMLLTRAPAWPSNPDIYIALHRLADHFDYLGGDAAEHDNRIPIYTATDVWERAADMTRRTARDAAVAAQRDRDTEEQP